MSSFSNASIVSSSPLLRPLATVLLVLLTGGCLYVAPSAFSLHVRGLSLAAVAGASFAVVGDRRPPLGMGVPLLPPNSTLISPTSFSQVYFSMLPLQVDCCAVFWDWSEVIARARLWELVQRSPF